MPDFSMDEFSDLQGTGVEGRVQVAPEDEFFHSVYIAGKTRKNHAQITERAGQLQVRGVEYNLDEVHMIITHVKEILVKEVQRNNRSSLECFSFKEGSPPWFGTKNMPDGSKRQCPMNSEQRAAVEFCNPCRSQIIVAGIYCNPDGSPILKEAEDGQKKPQFVFIRGKGTKYNNVSTYLNECFQMEYPPIFDPVTEESTKFEKSVVNNKRHVTKITMGTAPSAHGEKDVFVLSKGSELDPKTVYQILQVTKKTLDKFNDKFDWSKGAGAAASSYAPQEEGVMTFDEEKKQGSEPPKEEKAPEPEPQKENFSFDDVNF